MPDSQTRPTVGFIGLGDQGAPIAQAIADSGYPLHVWARRAESLNVLDGHQYIVHATVTDLAAACDVIGLCLREDSDNVQIAVAGGLLANMRRGAVLVNHGTGLPQEARHLAELAAPYGISVLDAPVSGGRAVAEARQLTTIVGGEAEIIQRLTPLFETFSKVVINLGPAGSGQHGKLFNNALMMMNHKNALDVLRLAEDLNLQIPALLDVLRSGSASSFALQAIGPSVTSDNVVHMTELELVDIGLFGDAVASLGEPAKAVIDRATAGAQELKQLTTMMGA